MYIGIIEADTGKYKVGSALLRDWHAWLADKDVLGSGLLLGVSKSIQDSISRASQSW